MSRSGRGPRSPEKETDAKRLGAKNFLLTSNIENFAKYKGQLDLIIDTVYRQVADII